MPPTPGKQASTCPRICSRPWVPVPARRRCSRRSRGQIDTPSSTGSEAPRDLTPARGASASSWRCWPEVRRSTPRLHEPPGSSLLPASRVSGRRQRCSRRRDPRRLIPAQGNVGRGKMRSPLGPGGARIEHPRWTDPSRPGLTHAHHSFDRKRTLPSATTFEPLRLRDPRATRGRVAALVGRCGRREPRTPHRHRHLAPTLRPEPVILMQRRESQRGLSCRARRQPRDAAPLTRSRRGLPGGRPQDLEVGGSGSGTEPRDR
jgi:hypothetical protein